MITLMLDNSAISLLHCKRRFQLSVIEGCQTMSNDIADHGNALHVGLEWFDKGRSVDDTLSHIKEEYPNVDINKVISMLTVYKLTAKSPPALILENGSPATEIKFNYPYTQVSTPQGTVAINLVGTIDRIYLDEPSPGNKLLVIRDYKSAIAETDSRIKSTMEGYDMTFQLPFYLYAAKMSGILPAEYRALIHEHKYRTEIDFLFYNSSPPQFKRRIFSPYPSDFIDREVPYIIDTKIKEVIEILSLSVPAPHDGMNVYMACKFCPFKVGCLSMGTGREQEFFARFERKPYNPLEFR